MNHESPNKKTDQSVSSKHDKRSSLTPIKEQQDKQDTSHIGLKSKRKNESIISNQQQNDSSVFQDYNNGVGKMSSYQNVNQTSEANMIDEQEQNIYAQRKSKKRFTTNKQEDNPYNPYQVPPYIKVAEEHQKALTVGPEVYSCQKTMKLCECCGQQIERRLLDINCPLTDLSFIGSGYPMFFQFIKFSIGITVLFFIVSGLYGIASNHQGDDCITPKTEKEQEKGCHSNWITIFSLGNKKSLEDKLIGQQMFNLVAIIFVIISLQIFRWRLRIYEQLCDDSDISPTDYTILVKDIPIKFDALNDDYDEDIKDFFENPSNMKGKKYNVTSINLCYNVHDYLSIVKQQELYRSKKEKLMRKKKKNQKLDALDSQELESLDGKISDLEDKIIETENFFHDGKGHEIRKYFTGWAFVSFNTEKEKDEILKEFQISHFTQICKNARGLIYHGKELQIEEAPDPRNVSWGNLHIITRQKFIRRSITCFANIIVLGGCCGTIVLLQLLQLEAADTKDPQDSDNPLTQFLAVLISIVIIVLNALIKFSINKSAEIEAYSTHTVKIIGIAKGLSWAQFFNTAVLPFLINVYFSKKDKYDAIFKTGGLVYNMFYVFIMTSLIPPLMGIIDIPNRIKQLLIKKNTSNMDECMLNQKELNELYELPDYDIAQGYAILLKSLFFTAFYSVIIPFGLLFSVAGLILQYWVEKYTILRRRSVKLSVSKQLAIEMTEMLEYILPIYAISNMLFFIYISDKSFPITGLIGIIISTANTFLPMQQINEKIFKVEPAKPNEKSYEDAYIEFDTDYCRENPATKNIAVEIHKLKIKLKNEQIKQQQNENSNSKSAKEEQTPRSINDLKQENTTAEATVVEKGIKSEAKSIGKNKSQSEEEIVQTNDIKIQIKEQEKVVNTNHDQNQKINESDQQENLENQKKLNDNNPKIIHFEAEEEDEEDEEGDEDEDLEKQSNKQQQDQ